MSLDWNRQNVLLQNQHEKKVGRQNFPSPSAEAHKGREVQGEASREMLAASVM